MTKSPVRDEPATALPAQGAALLVIDMQRDFIERDGVFKSLGIDVLAYRDVIPAIAHLRDQAAAAGLLFVPVQNAALPDRMSDSPAQIRFNMRMREDQAQHDSAMLLMRHGFDLARTDENVATWVETARLPAGVLAGDRLIG